MTATERRILENLRLIVNGLPRQRYPVMMGVVVAGSVDEVAMTCSVVLSVNDDDAPTEGVLLNGLVSNAMGCVLIPADESIVWVAEVDGPGKYGLVKCSELLKMTVTIGNVKWELTGSMVKATQGAAELTMSDGKFNLKNGSQDFKTVMDSLFTHLAAMTFTNGGGTTAPANNVADINSDKINFDQLFN